MDHVYRVSVLPSLLPQRVSDKGGSTGVVAVRGETEYFEVIGGLDQSGCVLRAVCEVAGAPTYTLTEDERSIMEAFR